MLLLLRAGDRWLMSLLAQPYDTSDRDPATSSERWRSLASLAMAGHGWRPLVVDGGAASDASDASEWWRSLSRVAGDRWCWYKFAPKAALLLVAMAAGFWRSLVASQADDRLTCDRLRPACGRFLLRSLLVAVAWPLLGLLRRSLAIAWPVVCDRMLLWPFLVGLLEVVKRTSLLPAGSELAAAGCCCYQTRGGAQLVEPSWSRRSRVGVL